MPGGKHIKLPVVGWVRMREDVRFSGKAKRVTISREADRWFASIMVETDDIRPTMQPLAAVGVDLGITVLATLSQGTPIHGQRRTKRLSSVYAAPAVHCRARNAARATRALAPISSGMLTLNLVRRFFADLTCDVIRARKL